MPAAHTARVSTDDATTETRVPLGAYARHGAGFERGLVILALGYPFWLEPIENGFVLLAPPEAETEARRHLACFEQENGQRHLTAAAPAPVVGAMAGVGPLLWALLVLGSYWAQQVWPAWVLAGRLDAAALFAQHEWWRLFTALFLHADGAHLIANGISGIFVFSAVLATLGRGAGWLLLTVAAVAGNFLAAVAHGSGPYLSYGASTAVFAALGLLAGRAAGAGRAASSRLRPGLAWAPLAAGLTLLGLYGAGGDGTDVVAHATGFAAGSILGLLHGALVRRTSE